MFGNFFEYCTLDNPVFCHGLFWGFIFVVTFFRTVQFKIQEAKEKAIEDAIINKYIEDQKTKKQTIFNKKPDSQTQPLQ